MGGARDNKSLDRATAGVDSKSARNIGIAVTFTDHGFSLILRQCTPAHCS